MSFSKIVRKFADDYEQWVGSHPCTSAEVESALKYLSYICTSQFENANLFSELIFTLSKLLAFFNDQIIFKSGHVPGTPNPYENKLKKWLTVINHCEVFFELSANKVWGARGKWIIILIIQLFKLVIRQSLLIFHHEQIVEVSPIQPLVRKNQSQVINNIALKSGRLIRPCDSSSSQQKRTWSPLNTENTDKLLNKEQLKGEMIYIFKPILHLLMMYRYGERSWKAWFFAYGADLLSLYLLSKSNRDQVFYSQRQRVEITRRTLHLLLYLMKSPFFDAYTKSKLLLLLTKLSHLPLFGVFFKSSIDYLPQWQQTYFYLWSS